jgi:phosphoribosyl 1,2-cyclic phosphodiesterase
MESPYFPVGLKELPSNVQIDELRDLDFQLGEVRVQAYFANHPGICVGYRLTTREGSIAFFPDNEPPHRLQHQHAAPQTDEAARREFAAGESRKFVEFLRDVDVLIMDAQYDAAEYEQHTGWGHGCVDDSVALALKAGVKKLVLFHHDPDHDDKKIDAFVQHARRVVARHKGKLKVEAAREGMVISVFPH